MNKKTKTEDAEDFRKLVKNDEAVCFIKNKLRVDYETEAGDQVLLKRNDVETVALLKRGRATHSMNLHPEPYEMIQGGQKTIELRLFDEKRRKIRPGDTIEFTNTATGETLRTRVVKLHRFASFDELYQALPLLQCGYTEADIAGAKPSDMDEYYSAEEQQKYGVVGIELTRDYE